MVGLAGTAFAQSVEKSDATSNYFSDQEYKIYSIIEGAYEYNVPYKTSNAKIDKMTIDCVSQALLVYLNDSDADGKFTINIPRKLIDAKINTQDDYFFVLINGFEANYKETTDSASRTLEISLTPQSTIIEIIATSVGMFPEPQPCAVADTNDSPYYNFLSPLKQFKSGILVEEIQCRNELILIQKQDGSPACVKPETKQKLIERGWAQDIYNKDQQNLSENSVESYKKKYDAVIEGKVLWSIGHKGYPLRLQYDIEPIKIHKTHPALRNDNTISFVGERDTATEIGKIAVFGLDYDEKDNYFRLVNRFILDSSTEEPLTRIEISFGNVITRNFLPVVFSEITTNAENLDEVTVWNFELIGHSGDDRRTTWDIVPEEARIFYEITDDGGQDIIDHNRMPENWAIPGNQYVYRMDCGGFQEVTGYSANPSSFPIKNNTHAVIAKNSWMGIYPDSDGEYSFEFASIFETTVKLPEGAKIISQESKNCKLTQNIEKKFEGKYTDGYYTKMVFRLE